MKHLIITGNVGRAPQVKTLVNGRSLMSFSVAVNGRKGDPTEWFGIVSNDLPKFREFLQPGRLVQVVGRPEFQVYNGALDISIYADHIELLGKGKEEDEEPSELTPHSDAESDGYIEHFDND